MLPWCIMTLYNPAVKRKYSLLTITTIFSLSNNNSFIAAYRVFFPAFIFCLSLRGHKDILFDCLLILTIFTAGAENHSN